MRFDIYEYTDIGGRTNNEDSKGVFRLEDSVVIAVADGLGGHERGEIASGIVIETLRTKLREPVAENTMLKALEEANNDVLLKAENSNMNTTLALLWLSKSGTGLTGNIGDSRIYQIRGESIIFQSRDHSLAQIDMMSGDNTYNDVRENPARNSLIRVVGMKKGFKADIESISYQKGDAFLICSDGFWENIYENEMINALNKGKTAGEWMLHMSSIIKPRLNENSDNNTAVTLIVS